MDYDVNSPTTSVTEHVLRMTINSRIYRMSEYTNKSRNLIIMPAGSYLAPRPQGRQEKQIRAPCDSTPWTFELTSDSTLPNAR
jgi:hypothetical protein